MWEIFKHEEFDQNYYFGEKSSNSVPLPLKSKFN